MRRERKGDDEGEDEDNDIDLTGKTQRRTKKARGGRRGMITRATLKWNFFDAQYIHRGLMCKVAVRAYNPPPSTCDLPTPWEEDDGPPLGLGVHHSLDRKRRWEFVDRKLACERLRAKVDDERAAITKDQLRTISAEDGGSIFRRFLPSLRRLCILEIRASMARETHDQPSGTLAERIVGGALPAELVEDVMLGEDEVAWTWWNRCGAGDRSAVDVWRMSRRETNSHSMPRLEDNDVLFEVLLAPDTRRWPFWHLDTRGLNMADEWDLRNWPSRKHERKHYSRWVADHCCDCIEEGE
jgi:hypothetical protein